MFPTSDLRPQTSDFYLRPLTSPATSVFPNFGPGYMLADILTMTKPERKRSATDASPDQRPDDRRRPEVIVEFLFDRGLFSLCVRNIGERPAIRISIKFNQKFTGLAGTKEFSSLPVFKNIEFLGPQREITTFVDRSSSYFSRKQPTRITVKLVYYDPEDRKYEATINHDLEIYRELVYTNHAGDF